MFVKKKSGDSRNLQRFKKSLGISSAEVGNPNYAPVRYRYEGEWANNCKNGYGVTTFADGSKEEGKYRNNLLQSAGRRLLALRASKVRERIDAAVAAATRAAQITLQKSDIANSRWVGPQWRRQDWSCRNFIPEQFTVKVHEHLFPT